MEPSRHREERGRAVRCRVTRAEGLRERRGKAGATRAQGEGVAFRLPSRHEEQGMARRRSSPRRPGIQGAKWDQGKVVATLFWPLPRREERVSASRRRATRAEGEGVAALSGRCCTMRSRGLALLRCPGVCREQERGEGVSAMFRLAREGHRHAVPAATTQRGAGDRGPLPRHESGGECVAALSGRRYAAMSKEKASPRRPGVRRVPGAGGVCGVALSWPPL